MLAAIVECSSDAIVATTPDGTITAWNAAAERFYGYTAEEAVGRSVAMLMDAELTARLPSMLARLAAGERIEPFESTRIRKDRSTVDVLVSIFPLRDRDGATVGTAGIHRDITERKRLAERQQQMMERSAQAERLESLGQLAGGIAHDFNNLLAIIMNYADFAFEQVPADPVRADIARIQAAAERACELTRQLLVFARREPGQVETVDLNTVVASVRNLFDRTLGEHVKLITRPAPGPLAVRADRGRMEQILCNLIINSRDAMPDGGMVVVETDTADIDEEQARPHHRLAPGPYAQLLVSDTGVGMTPEVIRHIFEPFFTTKPKERGTGLGLATVYGIVTEAGGDISVSSGPNVGTTFRVLLPLTDQPSTPPADTAMPVPRGHGQRIVVAEDHNDVRDLVVSHPRRKRVPRGGRRPGRRGARPGGIGPLRDAAHRRDHARDVRP